MRRFDITQGWKGKAGEERRGCGMRGEDVGCEREGRKMGGEYQVKGKGGNNRRGES